MRPRLPLCVAALVALLGTILSPAFADEPPRAPILRIETGMHTAPIQRIAVDAASRTLVTGSHDRTVRVWDIANGKLLQTLRPPIGEGSEGRIYAVAITPDGGTVACGGWTGPEWDRAVSIYLFDPASGRLRRRIGGLPEIVVDLAFSPKGDFLAAALGGDNGVRVFRTSDYAPAAADEDYDADTYGVDFDRAGRLVSASLDGFVRLYDSGFHLLTKRRGPGGSRPYCARFSPDGGRVAVAYQDSPRVDVLSGNNLSPLYAPDMRDVRNGNVFSVAWSPDGAALYAGGSCQDATGHCPVRRWSQAGRGAFTDLRAPNSTILDLHALKGGGVALGAGDPAFGVLGAGGARPWFHTGAIADYRDNLLGFQVADDGAAVRFAYQQFGKQPARFVLASRLLDSDLAAASPASGLAPPTMAGKAGLSVTGWKDTNAPGLNGKPLALEENEIARSLAIAPDGQSFLLGTEWALRLFDRNGNERWKVGAPGVAWSVNVAGNGRVAVAALGDGTIRWYRMRDGKELLAFFPHADRKRWVLWTPGGYYDASPGGEDLIGWHINQGKDGEAVFFPASRFRQVRYRPDVIGYILDVGDEAEALRLANEETGRRRQEVAVEDALPPTVRILAPANNAEVAAPQITVRYEVRSPANAPVTGIKVLVDGRPVETPRRLQEVPASPGAAGPEITVTVPKRDSDISILAENRFATSAPATVRVRWRGAAPTEDALKPKLYVLAVGVGKYKDPELTLRYPAKDADDFTAALQKQSGGLYREVVVKSLTDGQATRETVLDGLEWIQKQTTSRDVAMVFLSGHGANDPNGNYYFLPADFNRERFKSTGVSFSDIKTTLEALAGKALFFVDTCHSGNVLGRGRARGGEPDITGIVNELTDAENGCVVFASSTGRQVSLEDPAWGNGAFTRALVEGLGGRADIKNSGRITVNMLDLYISERVKELTKGSQTPTTTKPQTIPDFPVAVRR